MHTGFVFSADIIAEETKDYIHDNNLPMDLSNMCISRQWLLQSYVQDVIVKHVENDLRVAMKDDSIEIQKPVSSLAFKLLEDNLHGYKEDQITFDNIIPLVHAVLKDNWGIEVETVSRPSAIDRGYIRWYISNVEFVGKDSDEQVTKEEVPMPIHKDYMRFIVMEDTPEAWEDWEAKWEELSGLNGGIEPENITLIMPDGKTPISNRAYSQQFLHEIVPEEMLDLKTTTKRKWENRHRARIGLGMVEDIIQVAPHIKAYDWHKPFNDED